jgi:hypothetical protein
MQVGDIQDESQDESQDEAMPEDPGAGVISMISAKRLGRVSSFCKTAG